ncbi:aminoglycoside 3'-phosphotransferase [Paenibacillus kobensis]|uniref:aminoglycoside 3'-phosphotransferase n=1 Tax=Paenibacillus kobensis TaxID=59841 RepID=UPI000FDB1437|nr:aminoglycoside 3'-phosphotransferase [Paenibacillus kobensis]
MKRTEVAFDVETVPSSIRPYIKGAAVYDSSCSEDAKTLYISGSERAFLKISSKGSLEREYRMTNFLHRHLVAPRAIAYESDSDYDYLLTESVTGEDGTAEEHIANPNKLASVFGENLRRLHSLPVEGCPYSKRTVELVDEARTNGFDLQMLNEFNYSANDNVVIHGDYCLPNIIMDDFSFKGFIDLGSGGIGDRHYDLYWGIWTLQYNLKTDRYRQVFLDAYGRSDIDEEGLNYFTILNQLTD